MCTLYQHKPAQPPKEAVASPVIHCSCCLFLLLNHTLVLAGLSISLKEITFEIGLGWTYKKFCCVTFLTHPQSSSTQTPELPRERSREGQDPLHSNTLGVKLWSYSQIYGPRQMLCPAQYFTWICSRTSLCISTAMWYTSWSELLYITAFWNISIISRWNSAVVRISPFSMFFLMVDKSIGLWRNAGKTATEMLNSFPSPLQTALGLWCV